MQFVREHWWKVLIGVLAYALLLRHLITWEFIVCAYLVAGLLGMPYIAWRALVTTWYAIKQRRQHVAWLAGAEWFTLIPLGYIWHVLFWEGWLTKNVAWGWLSILAYALMLGLGYLRKRIPVKIPRVPETVCGQSACS